MDRIRIKGGNAINGECRIAGAKNACLALMPAALLCAAPLRLTNCPRLSDIRTMRTLLASLGCKSEEENEGEVIELQATHLHNHRADYEIVRKMRASILVLGPLLARLGVAEVSLPGGCAIGDRPVDIHLEVIKALGAKYELISGYIHAEAPKGGLKGGEYEFPFVSVGATETALLAAATARGTSRFVNAAREPEIVDLAELLNKMGAKISGAGSDIITIEGVSELHAAEHAVIMDRIELGSYMIAPALTCGELFFPGARRDLIEAFIVKLDEAGVDVLEEKEGLRVRRKAGGLQAINVTTAPFPGFPTDLQAQLMSLLCLADGVSHCEETIFENRFMHAPELARMGANIEIEGNTAKLTGIDHFTGAEVMATDLRASFSLILAALAAEGESIIRRVYHVDRGYEHLVRKLRALGADIVREEDK